MFEAKVTFEAPQIAEALNNVAAALSTFAHMTHQQTAPINQVAGMQQTVPTAQQIVSNNIPAAAQTVQAQTVNNVIPINTQQSVAVQQPTVQTQAQTVVPPASNIPLSQAPQYTIEQIMTAGGVLADSPQRRVELVNLLSQFGVQAVTQLKPEQLGAFAVELRKLGAQI